MASARSAMPGVPTARKAPRGPLKYNASGSIDGDAMTGSDSLSAQPGPAPGRALPSPSATVPISLVNGFLASAAVQRDVVERYLGGAGIPIELLGEPHARVTEEQFSTLYRTPRCPASSRARCAAAR